ncbi:hypothetical protein [Paraburkholderia sediminicola]|uniref:hypothetical protein n=1 Tax=Paraburkholderia sediminicola TaxID=458836 RepID=UPI0038B92BB3
MPVGTTPPTETASEDQINRSEPDPPCAFKAVLSDLSCKAILRVTVKVVGDIVIGVTIGLLLGYAARSDTGSTLGGLIGGAVGLVCGCVKAAEEWPELLLEQLADRRARQCENLSRCAEHGPDSRKVAAFAAAADEFKAAADEHRRAIMSRYISGKNVDVERGIEKVALFYREALGLYKRALSLAAEGRVKGELEGKIQSLEDLL